MIRLYSNQAAAAELASGINDTADSVPTTSSDLVADGWPDPGEGQEATALLRDGAAREVIAYTGIDGGMLTGVTRNADGDTPAASWSAGAEVLHVHTARISEMAAQSMGVVLHGSDPDVPRPVGFQSVTWIGSADPENRAEHDIWHEVADVGNIEILTESGIWDWEAAGEPATVDVLAVGGGAGGGRSGTRGGGGGGAGGVKRANGVAVSGNVTVTVGLGGPGSDTSANGGDGQNSSFGALVEAVGGGGGARGEFAGRDGGSGGGGGGDDTEQLFAGGEGTEGQGNDGGDAIASSAGSGGGGGAGEPGAPSSGTHDGGDGGDGVADDITGTSIFYGGGGGGAGDSSGGGSSGTGGLGGGGNAGTGASGQSGEPGTGGGGGGSTGGTSGDGGRGVVIVRW